MPTSSQAHLPDTCFKSGNVIIEFNETLFIQKTLATLLDLHGGYNELDEKLVVQLASFQRSWEIADANLKTPNQHLAETGSNGTQPCSWVKIRQESMKTILSIRKDLGLDMASRSSAPKGRDTINFFESPSIEPEPVYR